MAATDQHYTGRHSSGDGQEPRVSAVVLAPLGDYLGWSKDAYGALLRRFGLDPAEVAAPETFVSLNTTARVLLQASLETGDPSLGLHYGKAFPPGRSGIVGHAMLTAPSIREALVVGIRYARVTVSLRTADYVENAAGARVSWCYADGFVESHFHLTGWAVAAVLTRIRAAAGAGWYPTAVELDCRLPERPDDYARVLGPNLIWNCPAVTISIDRTTLGAAMPAANAVLHRIVAEAGDGQLRRHMAQAEPGYRAALTTCLGDGRADLADVAREVGVPTNELRAQLRTDGIEYRDLLDETRRGIAARLIRDTSLPFTEIAYRLSYSDPSALSRACQRWFGATPREYRRDR